MKKDLSHSETALLLSHQMKKGNKELKKNRVAKFLIYKRLMDKYDGYRQNVGTQKALFYPSY